MGAELEFKVSLSTLILATGKCGVDAIPTKLLLKNGLETTLGVPSGQNALVLRNRIVR